MCVFRHLFERDSASDEFISSSGRFILSVFYLYQYSSDLDEYELYIYIRYEYYFNIHVPYTSILTQPLAK